MWLTNIKKRLKRSHFLQITPDVVALARVINDSISGSTTIVFDPNATFLRNYATVQDVLLKWGATTVTSSNFDEVIPAGQIVDLLIPNGIKEARFIQRDTGAKIIIIQK